ncbi:class I SAM-dependent methyltransferase [Amphibacillus jilinensis]|uniref:class I SAM-dependent methyltransferase n=1 Tax=Amphibacillus jilinensis TaxID=1216008 RepID=UPI0002EFC100|nr:class I SAM-dependent methyltransferase [Amphibacillus jilinensis]
MSEQYFAQNPQAKSKPMTWAFDLRGHTLKFTSDVGVFSKNEVDFGSRALIEAFIPPNIDGDFVDLGCGYGPIGLSLAKAFPNRHVLLGDINERAIALAKTNAKHNHIDNISCYLSDRFTDLPEQLFAAVITNPPIRAGKKVVHQIFSDSYQRLMIGGELWVVIQKKQGAPSAIQKLNDLFAKVETVKKSKGYFIIRARK